MEEDRERGAVRRGRPPLDGLGVLLRGELPYEADGEERAARLTRVGEQDDVGGALGVRGAVRGIPWWCRCGRSPGPRPTCTTRS